MAHVKLCGCCLLAFVLAARAVFASGTQPPITAVAISPDGTFAVVCSQAGVQVRKWPNLEMVTEQDCSFANIHDVAFSPDGKQFAIAGGAPAVEGGIELMKIDSTDMRIHESDRIVHHEDSVTSVAWLGERQVAWSSLDHSIITYDLRDKAVLHHLTGHSRGVTSLAWLPSHNALLSGGLDQNLRVWDLESGELVRTMNNHTQPVVDTALRPGDYRLPMVASIGEDRTVRLWQPTIGRMVRFSRCDSLPLSVSWTKSGNQILVNTQQGELLIIDPDAMDAPHNAISIPAWSYALAVHPTDGSFLVGGDNGQLLRIMPPSSSSE